MPYRFCALTNECENIEEQAVGSEPDEVGVLLRGVCYSA